MEGSQALQRNLFAAFARLAVCDCASSLRPKIASHPGHIQRRFRRTNPSQRFISTSLRRQQETSPSAKATEQPPPPPNVNSKESLRTYTKSLHKVIEGFDLKNKLPSAQYEALVKAAITAETKMDAPGQSVDAFGPALHFLKQQVEPILSKTLNSTDVSKLAERAARQPKETPIASISSQLDAIFGAPSKSSWPSPPERPQSTVDKLTDNAGIDSISELIRSSGRSSGLSESERLRSLEMQDQLYRGFGLADDDYLKKDRNKPLLRLKPTLGKTVDVGAGYDLTRAFRAMESLCARNGVRRDMMAQRFHVRRGQLKKNMRIMRWRKLFKEGFLKECERVRRMRRQGW